MPLVFFGLILLVLAALALGFSLHYRRKARVILGTETLTVGQLEDLSAQAEKAVGQGFFSRTVEVKGVGECANPLSAPLTQTPCICFRARVIRRYEYQSRSGGRSHGSRKVGEETMSQDEQFVEFLLRDATGTIPVEARSANIDYLKVVDRFEPAQAEQVSLSVGPLSFTLPRSLVAGSRTLGYKYTEEVLPLGRRLYVLGEATDSQGRLTIRKPSEGNVPFLISLKSEEELLASARGWAQGLRLAALLAGALGLVFILGGLVFELAR